MHQWHCASYSSLLLNQMLPSHWPRIYGAIIINVLEVIVVYRPVYYWQIGLFALYICLYVCLCVSMSDASPISMFTASHNSSVKCLSFSPACLCLYVCTSVCLSVSLSVCQSLSLYMSLCVCMSVCLTLVLSRCSWHLTTRPWNVWHSVRQTTVSTWFCPAVKW